MDQSLIDQAYNVLEHAKTQLLAIASKARDTDTDEVIENIAWGVGNLKDDLNIDVRARKDASR